MMGHWYGSFGWIGLIINLVLTIGLIIGIVFFIIWIIKEINKNNISQKRNSSAQEIVKERYAKGEITREEFQEILSNLETR